MQGSFHYVYILRDVATGKHHYTGVTQDLQERLAMHNSGHVPHTSNLLLGTLRLPLLSAIRKRPLPMNATLNQVQVEPTL